MKKILPLTIIGYWLLAVSSARGQAMTHTHGKIDPDRVKEIIYLQKKKYPRLKVVPTALVMGVISQESSFRVNAVSSADARGLMQVKPITYNWIKELYSLDVGSNEYEPVNNITVGMHYLARQINLTGNLFAGIQAYYTGLKGYRSGRRNYEYMLKVLHYTFGWLI